MSIVVSDPILKKLFCIKYSNFKEYLVKCLFKSNKQKKHLVQVKSLHHFPNIHT